MPKRPKLSPEDRFQNRLERILIGARFSGQTSKPHAEWLVQQVRALQDERDQLRRTLRELRKERNPKSR